MIRSMTGYGRGEHIAKERKFTVEIKSVNHRYNDISIKLPRSMQALEDQIKKCLLGGIFRGKTDVYINFETFSTEDISVKLNEPLAQAYVARLGELQEKFSLHSSDTLNIVARFPDIITVEKVQGDQDVLWESLLPALEEAVENFLAMRSKEGSALAENLVQKKISMEGQMEIIKERAPAVAAEYREKLLNRMKEFLTNVEIEEQRIATEAALFADRSCIDEEITRMESHLIQFSDILEEGGQVGRKLDFLVQEMNREVNTMASKSNDITMTRATIELKSEIEKIREQIQNIE